MLPTAILSQVPDQRQRPEPQPADADARQRFMWLGGCETGFGATSISLADDGQRLSVTPRGIPYWFVSLCLAVPFAAVLGLFLYVRMVFAMFPGIAWVCVSLTNWLNRQAGDGLVRAVLDRTTPTLEVCDYGLTLDSRQIVELILIRGWQTIKDEDGTTSAWAAELSVVGLTPDGATWRWHIVTT